MEIQLIDPQKVIDLWFQTIIIEDKFHIHPQTRWNLWDSIYYEYNEYNGESKKTIMMNSNQLKLYKFYKQLNKLYKQYESSK